jgi:hypothetical protein
MTQTQAFLLGLFLLLAAWVGCIALVAVLA